MWKISKKFSQNSLGAYLLYVRRKAYKINKKGDYKMAVSKEISTTALAIEVESGVDSSGNTTYSKKSFSGVKDGADPEKVYAVADAIKGVLGANTRYYYLTEVSLLKSEQ